MKRPMAGTLVDGGHITGILGMNCESNNGEEL